LEDADNKNLLKEHVHGDNIKTAPITDYDASITNREFGIFQAICVKVINYERCTLKPKTELL
jgi:hypothetical protein